MSDDRIITSAMLRAQDLDRIEELERELAEARKDAERWKHWKNFWMNDATGSQLPHDVFLLMDNLALDEAFDAAIDAAMEKGK